MTSCDEGGEDTVRNEDQDSIWQQIRRAHPLIHAITNAVTMNTVVNGILAAGASAICASAPEEAAEITAESQGLLLNTGTPDAFRRQAMLLSGKRANALGIPVVLDPVGAGASAYREELLRELLTEVHMTCIRCNMSEIAALYGLHFPSRGVESGDARLTPDEMQELAARYGTVLAVTGETDYAVSAEAVLISDTGTALQKKVTGAGCLLSGLCAAALAADTTGNPVQTAHALLRAYGSCAEAAEQTVRRNDRSSQGTGSFLSALIDAISRASGTWET